MDDWSPVEKVAKNAEGKYMALSGGEWKPAERVAKNAQGAYVAYFGAPREKLPDDVPAVPGSDEAKERAARPKAPDLSEQQPGESRQAYRDRRFQGAGEAAMSAISSIGAGVVGPIAGVARGISEIPQVLRGRETPEQGYAKAGQTMDRVSGAMTYQPRSPTGQAMTQSLGEGMNALGLAGLGGMAPQAPKIPQIARGLPQELQRGAQAAGQISRAGADPAVASLRQQTGDFVPPQIPRQSPPQVAGNTVGAAQTSAEALRRQRAGNLPIPLPLTKGDVSRDFADIQFERSTAKNPKLGGPLRERRSKQNQIIAQNFDAWVDQVGAEAPDARAVGGATHDALWEQATKDKSKIQAAYAAAEEAGELRAPVGLDGVVDFLNKNRAAASTAPVLKAAEDELIRLGGARRGADGTLEASALTLKDTEQLRRFVNDVTGFEKPNQLFARRLKSAIDSTTENAGGDLYKNARALRAKYAAKYENQGVIEQIMGTKKGSADRKIANEDVFSRVVLDGSYDDIVNARRALRTSGEKGKQAFREIQGEGLRYLKEAATRNAKLDEKGNRYISPAGLDRAVKELDKDGKLEALYGKKGAQDLRDFRDLVLDVYTTPEGAVNFSNSASAIMTALDSTFSAVTGIPAPLASAIKIAKNKFAARKTMRKVQEHLNP